ncbi:endolysin [Bacteriophage Eos]|nr:endolysin [Bacteriophage Eos]
MDKFIQLASFLLQEAKDPATLLKRLLTLLVGLVLYLVIMNTSEVMSFLKTFSTTAVLQEVKQQRQLEFPNIAREKSMILFSQTRADAVYVVKYKPEAINDYQTIIAWEGNAQLDRSDTTDKAVNKTSELYRNHLEGFTYAVKNEVKVSRYSTTMSLPELKNIHFDYVYTCPYFNLNNIYSGYIAIAWETPPVGVEDMDAYTNYLAKLCSPQQRALGRAQ